MKNRLCALVCALTLLVCAVPARALTGEGTRAADVLTTLNVVRGAYNVDDPATRNQAVVLLVRLVGAEKAAAADKTHVAFTDLAAWAAPSIRYACGQGWINGVAGDAFGGEQTVTAGVYCTALLRALGYTNGEFSPENAPAFARRMAVTNRVYDGALTRGDLFELTAGALTASYRDGGTVAERLVSSGTAPAAAVNALTGGALTARQAADRFTAAVFQFSAYADDAAAAAKEPSGSASGFFISADGLAVTNYHAIAGAAAAEVTLVNGETCKVESVVYYDAEADLAVIRVAGGKAPFVHLEMAGRDTLRAGDAVYTISNPLGLGLAVSSGIISDVSREVETYSLPCIMSTADISQGSSGGALLNAYGQVVGITSGAFVFGNNMYLAVPLDPVINADLTGGGRTLAQVKQYQSSLPSKNS